MNRRRLRNWFEMRWQEIAMNGGQMIGWECPRCGAVYGPQVQTCGRCTERTYTGTGNDTGPESDRVTYILGPPVYVTRSKPE